MGWKRKVELDASVGTMSEGVHLAKCTKSSMEPSKDKTSENLVLEFTSMKPGEKGRRARMWLSMKESVAWKRTEVLIAFGVNPAELVPDENGDITYEMSDKDFDGKLVQIIVEHEDRNGETQPSIKKVLPYDGELYDEDSAASPASAKAKSTKTAKSASKTKNTPF